MRESVSTQRTTVLWAIAVAVAMAGRINAENGNLIPFAFAFIDSTNSSNFEIDGLFFEMSMAFAVRAPL